MSSKTNHWKLGAFVVAAFSAGLLALFYLGAGELTRTTVESVTYFDESVQGLEVGSPVKFRGVTVGAVTEITVAPDKRNVEVHAKAYMDVLKRLGLGDLDRGARSENVRVQLAMAGITGAKFLQVDFFDPEIYPAPSYDFRIPDNHIPSAASTLKSIEGGFMTAVAELPEMIAQFRGAARKFEDALEQLDVPEVSRQLRSGLSRMESALARLDEADITAELKSLLEGMRKLTDTLNSEAGPVDKVVEDWRELTSKIETEIERMRLGDTAGNLRATSDAFRGLAIETTGMTAELYQNLRLLAETLDALRALVAYLERDPGALLRGRAGGGDD